MWEKSVVNRILRSKRDKVTVERTKSPWVSRVLLNRREILPSNGFSYSFLLTLSYGRWVPLRSDVTESTNRTGLTLVTGNDLNIENCHSSRAGGTLILHVHLSV